MKINENFEMKKYHTTEQLVDSIEEDFQDYQIFIDNNSDKYRGGFEWSISKDDEIFCSDLAFNIESAFSDAQQAVIKISAKQ
ncbi:MAG: hypothetical protein EOP53_22130 [Sphingobacteriales bacterium]|nr:MAG: hypothetical protein EOP53_22130 [Sphingobacteriales bacterium]